MTLHSSSNVPAQSSKDVPTTAPSKTANNTTSEIGASASLVKFIDLARWEHNNDNHYHWEGKVSLKDLLRIYALGDEHHDKIPRPLFSEYLVSHPVADRCHDVHHPRHRYVANP